VFRDFLNKKQRKFEDESVLWAFVAGAERFVTRLADLARMLSEEETSSYGLFYAYWLSKFYGYDLTDDGYERDDEQEDWSEAILQSKRIASLIEQRKQIALVEKQNKPANQQKDVESDPQNLLVNFQIRDGIFRKLWAETITHMKNNPILPSR
jgi:hypothetical protein